MFPRYLQYLLTDFRQTFVTGASRDRDCILGSKGQMSRSHHRGGGYCRVQLFLVMPMPLLHGDGGVIFLSSVRVWASVCPSVMLFPWYLWYALMDFHRTFVSNASWDKDEQVRGSKRVGLLIIEVALHRALLILGWVTVCVTCLCFPFQSRLHLGLSVYCGRYVVNIWKSLGIWWGLESGHPVSTDRMCPSIEGISICSCPERQNTGTKSCQAHIIHH